MILRGLGERERAERAVTDTAPAYPPGGPLVFPLYLHSLSLLSLFYLLMVQATRSVLGRRSAIISVP
jgi:hypothetical protein